MDQVPLDQADQAGLAVKNTGPTTKRTTKAHLLKHVLRALGQKRFFQHNLSGELSAARAADFENPGTVRAAEANG